MKESLQYWKNRHHQTVLALDAAEQRAEQAEADREQLREQLKQVTDALDTLFDAHYGTSYHHCGDGDGLTEDEVKLIVGIVKKNRGEK